MANERFGLDTFLETKEFNKGLDQYLKGLEKAVGATRQAGVNFNTAANRWQDSITGKFIPASQAMGRSAENTSQAVEKSSSSVKKAQQEMSFLEGLLRGAGGQMGKFGSVALAAASGPAALGVVVGSQLVQAFSSLTQEVNKAIDAVLSFGMSSLQIAGNVDELQRTALLLGQQAGYTNDQMLGFFDSLNETGIRADVAGGLLSQLARYNIDLAQATDLATVAQNAGVLVGRDSSDVLESLTRAAVTNQVEVARTAGVVVNFTDAQEKLAQSLGKSREDLTSSQRTQANFNAILEEGAKISGVYGVAMGSPTKSLRSLGREIYNLQAALGAPFLDAWATVIEIVRDFVQDITAAVTEGGSLYPILVNIGAAASLLADGLRVGADAVRQFLFSLAEDFGSNFDNIAYNAIYMGSTILANLATGMVDAIVPILNALYQVEKSILDTFSDTGVQAVNYGVEIVVNLATGIIDAATTVLVSALEYIGSILSYWLGPGSPPKVAPDIDQWGAQAMAEYLRGFTEADFGVLSSLESAFQSALGEEGLKGVMDELLTAVDMGSLSDELFAQLASQSGAYGQELAQLTRLELDYAAAAERANRATMALDQAEQDVSATIQEYNDLRRSGASREVLAAKLDEINAAKKRVDVAKQEAKAADTNIGQLEDQTKPQRELVKQLSKFFKVQPTAPGAGAGAAAGAAAGLGKGVGAAIESSFAGMNIDPSSISTRIGEAIETAKQRLIDLFTGPNSPFAPLITAWEQDIKPQIDQLMITLFGGVVEGEPTEGLVQSFQTAAGEIATSLGTIQTKWDEITLLIQGNIDTLKGAFDGLKQRIAELIGPVDSARSSFVGSLIPAFDSVSNFINTIIAPAFLALSEIIQITNSFAAKVLATVWQTILLPALLMLFQFIQTSIMPLFTALADLAGVILANNIKFLAGIWQNILYPALQIVVMMTQVLSQWWKNLLTQVEDELIPVLKFLGEVVLATINNGFGSIERKIKGIIEKIEEFRKKIMDIEVPWWLQPGSPPPLAMGLADIAAQMDNISMRQIPTLRSQMKTLTLPPILGGGGASQDNRAYTDSRQATFNVENYTQMDERVFFDMADRWFSSRMSGAA